jgi:hypothetical protein
MHAADKGCGPDKRTKRHEVIGETRKSLVCCCNFATNGGGKRALLAIGVLREFVMRMIAILAVFSVALTPLGGCFFHHNQAVVAQPLPPLK